MRNRPAAVFPRTRPIQWTLLILAENFASRTGMRVIERRRFTSLSQMARSLASNPVPDDTWVVLERNGQLIYRGPWGEALPDTPTQ